MILAAIGDIHGNLFALEAVLAEIDAEGIQTIVNTGDCVAGHPWPNEVIQTLKARRIPTVQGNCDRHVLRAQRKRKGLMKRYGAASFEVLEEAHQACSAGSLEYLRALPRTLELTIDGVVVALCHGTPASQSERLFEHDEASRFQRQRECASAAPLVICGATHQPYRRAVDGTLFVNPGSVGAPEDAADDLSVMGGVGTEAPAAASYALITTEEEPWHVEFHKVAYSVPSE